MNTSVNEKLVCVRIKDINNTNNTNDNKKYIYVPAKVLEVNSDRSKLELYFYSLGSNTLTPNGIITLSKEEIFPISRYIEHLEEKSKRINKKLNKLNRKIEYFKKITSNNTTIE